MRDRAINTSNNNVIIKLQSNLFVWLFVYIAYMSCVHSLRLCLKILKSLYSYYNVSFSRFMYVCPLHCKVHVHAWDYLNNKQKSAAATTYHDSQWPTEGGLEKTIVTVASNGNFKCHGSTHMFTITRSFKVFRSYLLN